MSCSGDGVVLDDELDRLGGDRIGEPSATSMPEEPRRRSAPGGLGHAHALVDRLGAEEWQQVREVQC